MTNQDVEQLFVLDYPVPSLKCHSVRFKDNKWQYVYAFKTPVYLTAKNSKDSLYLRGALQNLTLTYEKPAYMVAIEIRSTKDIEEWLERQAKCDMKYRDDFIKHSHEELIPKTIVLSNKNQIFNDDTYIVGEVERENNKTRFIGIQNKTINHYGVF